MIHHRPQSKLPASLPKYSLINVPPEMGNGGYLIGPARNDTPPADPGTPCSFGYVYKREGHTFLQGGQVFGGTGNFVIEEIDLGETADLSESGYLYLTAHYTALTVDGVLLPGGNLTSANIVLEASSIPSNSIPTASSPNGQVHVQLGVYTENGFFPAGCGNIGISHCPGSLVPSRGGSYGPY